MTSSRPSSFPPSSAASFDSIECVGALNFSSSPTVAMRRFFSLVFASLPRSSFFNLINVRSRSSSDRYSAWNKSIFIFRSLVGWICWNVTVLPCADCSGERSFRMITLGTFSMTPSSSLELLKGYYSSSCWSRSSSSCVRLPVTDSSSSKF